MKLWGVPFVLIGLYLVAGRFLLDAWIRRGISYAVTNRRVLILRSGPFSKFSAMSLDQLPEVNLSERADGRGTIRFGAAAPYGAGRGLSGWTPALDSTLQFIAIEDACPKGVRPRSERGDKGRLIVRASASRAGTMRTFRNREDSRASTP
jgi:hypothetical protein